MTLQGWFNHRGINPIADLVRISVITDGLSIRENNLMGIVLQRGKTKREVFVEGASPGVCQAYTGMPPGEYDNRKLSKRDALGETLEIVNGSAGIVSYNVKKFSRPWLCKLSPGFKTVPILDVSHVSGAGDAGYYPEPDILSYQNLCDWYDGVHFGCSKVSFIALASSLGVLPNDEEPLWQARARQLEVIWGCLIDRR